MKSFLLRYVNVFPLLSIVSILWLSLWADTIVTPLLELFINSIALISCSSLLDLSPQRGICFWVYIRISHKFEIEEKYTQNSRMVSIFHFDFGVCFVYCVLYLFYFCSLFTLGSSSRSPSLSLSILLFVCVISERKLCVRRVCLYVCVCLCVERWKHPQWRRKWDEVVGWFGLSASNWS